MMKNRSRLALKERKSCWPQKLTHGLQTVPVGTLFIDLPSSEIGSREGKDGKKKESHDMARTNRYKQLQRGWLFFSFFLGLLSFVGKTYSDIRHDVRTRPKGHSMAAQQLPCPCIYKTFIPSYGL